MRTIALANQKGGVGKTTTAVNLAAGLSRLGRRVLLIDLDPQANATVALGLKPHLIDRTVYHMLCGGATAAEAVRVLSPTYHLIPSSLDLAGAELELSQAIGRESVLRDRLEGTGDYDFVLVDCPPSLGLLNINAFTYVREVFVPLQCEFLALHGISLLLRTIDLVRRRLNPSLEVAGIIPTMYDMRRALAKETLAEIEQFFGAKVLRTRIRTNVRLAESPSHGKSIFDYAPDSHGAEDYDRLAREITGVRAEPPAATPAEPVPLAPPSAAVAAATG